MPDHVTVVQPTYHDSQSSYQEQSYYTQSSTPSHTSYEVRHGAGTGAEPSAESSRKLFCLLLKIMTGGCGTLLIILAILCLGINYARIFSFDSTIGDNTALYTSPPISIPWAEEFIINGNASSKDGFYVQLSTDTYPSGSDSQPPIVRMCIPNMPPQLSASAQALIPPSTDYDSPFQLGSCGYSGSAQLSRGIPLCSLPTIYLQVLSTSTLPQSFDVEIYYDYCNSDVEDCVCPYGIGVASFVVILVVLLVIVGCISCCLCCCGIVFWIACGAITIADCGSKRSSQEISPLI